MGRVVKELDVQFAGDGSGGAALVKVGSKRALCILCKISLRKFFIIQQLHKVLFSYIYYSFFIFIIYF